MLQNCSFSRRYVLRVAMERNLRGMEKMFYPPFSFLFRLFTFPRGSRHASVGATVRVMWSLMMPLSCVWCQGRPEECSYPRASLANKGEHEI